jgi:malonyl-CoA O-methyltransferase
LPVEHSIDKQRARLAFAKAADQYDQAAVLQLEIGQRLLQCLDYVKLQPQRILDIGCGTGRHTAELMRRYPKAEVIGLDFALPMLRHTRKQGRWLRHPHCVCADLDQLPLAEQSMDLVFSNMALQWSTQPASTLACIHHLLKPNGLFMFSTLGPDTLLELRQAWSQVDNAEHIHPFVDMHDYGDMLMQGGFAEPVMDMERITMTYADITGLMRDLKKIGAHNAAEHRPTGLTGRKQLHALQQAYEAYRDLEGRLPASYEVIYGHAWGAQQRRNQTGEVRVAVEAISRR